MDYWWLLVIAFLLGVGCMFLFTMILTIGTTEKVDGELQIYIEDDGIYPVLALNDKNAMLDKPQVILEVKRIDSRK